MDVPGLQQYLDALHAQVDDALTRVLDGVLAAPPVVADPVRYALLGPGKRLRPCLTLAAAECAGAPRYPPAAARARALPGACAIEMIHTYSLVHDDLPAMDDDDLRRGRPTTHVVYGEGLGILAGDALLTEAFTVLAGWTAPATAPEDQPSAEQRLRAIERLAMAAGISGMVGGQAIDLAAAERIGTSRAHGLDAAALEDMHLRKTGALIRASCTIGGVLVGASTRAIDALDTYARNVGLAFQIVDDVLDIEGSAAALGKTAGKDAAAGKPTFPAFYGIEGSRRRAADCVAAAEAALSALPGSDRLRDIAAWSLTRTK